MIDDHHFLTALTTQLADLPTVRAVALAALQTAHAVLAGRGYWPTNEKTLLRRADLRDIDDLITNLTPSPEVLLTTLATAETRLTSAS